MEFFVRIVSLGKGGWVMNRIKETMADPLRRNAPDGVPTSAAAPRGSSARSPWSCRVAVLALLAAGAILLPGCVLLQRGSGSNNLLPAGQQPDKILYERSVNEIKHGHFDVGRLTLQTLLNTYPDSEYLAKAKLAIANSYFKQGGMAGLTEAEAEYKDFITFFPTAPEAPMAQYRVAMAHFRLMGKPDRDLTQARLAQAEFKEFLLKYSDSPLMPRAEARLREVQEVLAEGDYEVAHFYYEKRANPAAESRLKEIVERYPSFSMADRACWDLAQTYQRMNKPKMAVPYYDRLVALYPLSPLIPKAKGELASLHQPVPQPTLATLAQARADATDNTRMSFFQKFMGTFSSSPNLSATRHGPVIVSNAASAIEMAKNSQSGAGSGNTIAVQPVGESALKSGKAVDPGKPKADSTSAKKQGGSPQKTQKLESGSKSDTKIAAAPDKKKGLLHVFKSLYPF